MPKFDLRGTTYMSAFLMQAIVTTITSIVAILSNNALAHLPGQWRLVSTISITFISTLVVLLGTHFFFGYGGALIDTTSTHQRKKFHSRALNR